jgi:polysaccharide chain length determinant protein (PEP-CTERM system associated)
MNKPNQTQPNPFEPSEILSIFMRRRWFFIIPVIIVTIVGSILAVKLPKKYMASTTIIVQPQKLPESYVQPVISEDLMIRLASISEMILSRTNLERIIKDFNLYAGPNYERMFLEDKVADLRRSIVIENVADRNTSKNTASFKLSYTGNNPEQVQRITNTLASNIIDEDLKNRESRATGTSTFLEEELKNMETRLKEREESLRIYRENHRGVLPEQLEANLAILQRLQEKLLNEQKNLYEAQNQLMMLERQQSDMKRLQESTQVVIDGNTIRTIPKDDSADLLEKLNQKYAEFKSRYTDSHPDMVQLKNKIKELEDTIAREGSSNSTNKSSTASTTQKIQPQNKIDPLNVQQIDGIRVRIQVSNVQIQQTKDELAQYEKRVEDTPKTEEDLLSLQRDYENIKSLYNSLLNRKLEAEIAVNMEKKQKGEQFRIIDSAALPQKPSSPDMRKLFAMVLMAAFGSGAGLVLLLTYMDASLYKPEHLESLTGLSVLATIPSIIQDRDKLKARMMNAVFGIAVLIGLASTACFACLSFLGLNGSIALLRRTLMII